MNLGSNEISRYVLLTGAGFMKSEVEGISRQLRAWADSLQNTEIKGQRYLSEKERSISKHKKEKAEFLDMLKSYKK